MATIDIFPLLIFVQFVNGKLLFTILDYPS